MIYRKDKARMPEGTIPVGKSPPRVYIRTFGCQMNKYDSGIMADRFLAAGYEAAGAPEEADVILLNTCSVRERAKTRLLGSANCMKPLKKKNPSLVIAVCGCVAQEEGRRIFEMIPHADIVCGTRQFSRILSLVEKFRIDGKPVAETAGEWPEEKGPEERISEKGPVSFVTALRGCSSFCSYCIVPFLRGPERSRLPGAILSEINFLAAKGTREICLLGQNVLAYGRDLSPRDDFPALLERASSVPGVERLRFLTSHPRDAGPRIINAIRNIPAICPEIHLPVQSGSDRILSLMGRGYTRARYLELVSEFRDRVPGISITTDVIAGFPSETERDFKLTLSLLEEVGFDDAYLFKYSPRAGTKAALMENSVPEAEKTKRLQELIKTQKRISSEKNLPLAGTLQNVLVEGESLKSPGMLFGRTGTGKNVVFKGERGWKGRITAVRITKAGPFTLLGEIPLF